MISKGILRQSSRKGFKREEVYKAYKLFFGTLVSEPRIKIINLLRKKKRSVSELISELEIGQTSVSHNLARLRKCGFVKMEVHGKFRYYKLNDKTIKPLMDLIDKHMSQHCIHILEKTKEKKTK